MYVRVLEILGATVGEQHPNYASALNNRARTFLSHLLLIFQGKLDEAGPLYVWATEVWEKVLGPDHPQVATALNNRALLLNEQVRAVRVFQKIFCGARYLLQLLTNRAVLLGIYLFLRQWLYCRLTNPPPPNKHTFQGEFDKLDSLYVRVLEILGATVGEEHPNYTSALNNRAVLLEKQVRAVKNSQESYCGT